MDRREFIEEVRVRREISHGLGGPEATARQHQHGKLTARERIDLLLDDKTFQEVGGLVGQVSYSRDGRRADFVPSNVVTGYGRISNRSVAVSADDFTIRAGSSEATNPDKWINIERAALRERKPLIRLVDMAGGSVKILRQSGASKLPAYPTWPWVEILSHVPVVAVACGPCAGLGAQKVAASHFSVQVQGIGQIFAAGPRVVEPGVGEALDKDELGGVSVHAMKSGVVDNLAISESDAMEQVTRWLSYFPRHHALIPPRTKTGDDPNRRDERLLDLIPEDSRKVYRVRDLIKGIVDQESFFEVGALWGRGAVTGLARLDGFPVGILASDPYHHAGSQGEHEAEKYARFIDVCDTFNLPIVNLHDQAGTRIGKLAEERGTVRKTMRTLAAINQVTVPWFAVIVRRAFGLAGAGWGPWSGCRRVAWPSAQWGSLPVIGGVFAAHKAEIEASDKPDFLRQELELEYQMLSSPLRTAERFGVDDLIDPRDTRPMLCEWIADVYEGMEITHEPKHRGFRP